MKKIFFLVCMMLSTVVMAFAQLKQVAILEVVDKEGKLNYSQKLMLRSNLAKAVTNTAGYEAYDRTDIDAIMREHEFQNTGMVSNDQIKRLGEMTGVSYILVSEGALTGDGNIFVTAKLLNVETAKLVITDNKIMGLSSQEMQIGCEALANTLFGRGDNNAYKKQSTPKQSVSQNEKTVEKAKITKEIPQLVRISNKEYLYDGKSMDKKAYATFLRYNCPQAYRKYNVGNKLVLSGWICFGGGLGLIVLGGTMTALDVPEIGVPFTSLGSIATVGSIPLLSIGYVMRKKSVRIFNETCASSMPLTFNLTAGQNSLGIAMNF